MAKRFAFAVVLVGLAAACAPRQPDIAVVDPGAVTIEPVYQGKYGN